MNSYVLTSTLVDGYYRFSVYVNSDINSLAGFGTSLSLVNTNGKISIDALSISVNSDFDIFDINQSGGEVSAISFDGITKVSETYGFLLYDFSLDATLVDESTTLQISEISTQSFFDNYGTPVSVISLSTVLATDVDSVTYSTGDYTLSDTDQNYVSDESDSYIVLGNSADNYLQASSAGSFLSGGDGDDNLNGSVGDDIFDAGPGADLITGGSGYDRLIIDGQSYNYSIITAGGYLQLTGTDDFFTEVEGLIFNDVELNILELSFSDINKLPNRVLELSPEGAPTGFQASALDSVGGLLSYTLVSNLSGTAEDLSNRFTIGNDGTVYVGSVGLNYEESAIETIYVLVEGSDGLRFVAEGNVSIINEDESATGTLSIAGTVSEGGTVTASITDLSDVDGEITSTTYQWQLSDDGVSGWSDLTDATDSNLSLIHI